MMGISEMANELSQHLEAGCSRAKKTSNTQAVAKDPETTSLEFGIITFVQ
jgi:hypothetical protein